MRASPTGFEPAREFPSGCLVVRVFTQVLTRRQNASSMYRFFMVGRTDSFVGRTNSRRRVHPPSSRCTRCLAGVRHIAHRTRLGTTRAGRHERAYHPPSLISPAPFRRLFVARARPPSSRARVQTNQPSRIISADAPASLPSPLPPPQGNAEEVSWEDQQHICAFGRFNTRMHEVKAELKAKAVRALAALAARSIAPPPAPPSPSR